MKGKHLLFLLILILAASGCSRQSEDTDITKVIDSLFTAMQTESKLPLLGLAETNSPAFKVFSEENLYIGTLINREVKSMQVNRNHAVVKVSFQYNDGFHSLDNGNRDQNEDIIVTLDMKNKEWKISNIQKE
ncbi:hypothetical protein DVH26_17190 [Paenibacillus sp. H1-7]|nr:hypothetical protein DVH26_17190 [Paenibacillus sp. H1-7]